MRKIITYALGLALELRHALINVSVVKAEIKIFPQKPDTKNFRNYRHLPLSSFKNDYKNHQKPNKPKIYWSKKVIDQLQKDEFIYTEIPEFYEYTASIEKCNQYTSNEKLLTSTGRNFTYFDQEEIPSKYRGYKNRKKAWNYLKNTFFQGPRFNFDIRRSTLSNTLGFEIFGVFAREFIASDSVIGNYVGFQGFGADLNHENFTYSEKHFEYIYNGDRDYRGGFGCFGLNLES